MAQAPLNALRVFEAVARHGSFSRAADELCVTQSAVSHQVRHLEGWFGGYLFERQGNRALLLPHAADLGRALALAFADIEAACRQARKAGGAPTLTVAVIPSVAICWLIPRLAEFRARAPQVDIRVLYAIHGREMDFRDVDVAVVFAGSPPALPGMEATRFLPGASAPVCSRPFADAHGPLAAPESIAAAGLLHDTDHAGWQAWLAAGGIDAVPAGPVFDDFNLLRAATLAGQGVALCPLAIIGDDLAAGHVVQLSDRMIRDEYAYYLVWKQKPDPTGSISAFRDWLLATAQ
jgi:DNA-binding transcriptional LysR family regulator